MRIVTMLIILVLFSLDGMAAPRITNRNTALQVAKPKPTFNISVGTGTVAKSLEQVNGTSLLTRLSYEKSIYFFDLGIVSIDTDYQSLDTTPPYGESEGEGSEEARERSKGDSWSGQLYNLGVGLNIHSPWIKSKKLTFVGRTSFLFGNLTDDTNDIEFETQLFNIDLGLRYYFSDKAKSSSVLGSIGYYWGRGYSKSALTKVDGHLPMDFLSISLLFNLPIFERK